MIQTINNYNLYNYHLLILDAYICYSRSTSIEETIRCPDNMDDKAFDDFARECTETNLETPSFWTKTTMKQYEY